MNPGRILLADKNPELARSMKYFLSQFRDVEVIGDVYILEDTLNELKTLQPDLIIIDMNLCGANIQKTITDIKTVIKKGCLILLTMYNQNEYDLAAEIKNVDGIISKDEIGTKLMPMIRKCFRHGQQNNQWETV